MAPVAYGDNVTMQPGTHEVAHVSDTALMTAARRAMETARPGGLIRGPFAAQLAGEGNPGAFSATFVTRPFC
jgi:O-methyltransferase involved in polyketide biosynthesis